jgi:hypothetical protein
MLALKAAPMLLTTKGETVVQHKEIVEPEPLSLVATSRLITKDMDALKFEAAASLQILPLLSPGLFRSVDNHLVSSPYNSPTHLLDLNRLSLQDRIFALALTALRPIRKDYATAPYELSFNWEEVLGIVRGLATVIGFNWTSREFYTVIFRSLLKEDCDRVYMTDLDSHSHEEAVVSGGLLKYWFGTCNKERRNLATCKYRLEAIKFREVTLY